MIMLLQAKDDSSDVNLEQYILRELNNPDKKAVLQSYKAQGTYRLHNLFSVVMKVENVKYLLDDLIQYKREFLRDNDGRTWLHIAVKSNRSIEILEFLLTELGLNANEEDNYGFLPLHFACQKERLNEEEIKLLMKNWKNFKALSQRDETPLQFCCSNGIKLQSILKIFKEKNIPLDQLLKEIDDLSQGLPRTDKKFIINNKLDGGKLWLNLLRNTNEDKMIFYLNNGFLKEKYHLPPKETQKVIRICTENGQGILRYLKTKGNAQENMCRALFSYLTGLKCDSPSETENDLYHNSILFLTVVTGRLELVPRLLTYCQFNIILYGLLTCLICHKLLKVKEFSEQVRQNISKTKDFCETYSIFVLNRTAVRDLTKGKKTILSYLNRTDNSFGQNILLIAYMANCSKFLSLPACQESLNKLWKSDCLSPSRKFYIHSLFHLGFLCLFSYILVFKFYVKISIEEIVCYFYAFGYLCEEALQIYQYGQTGLLEFYKSNPNNYLDISGLSFMIVGFLIRIVVFLHPNLQSKVRNEFEESFNRTLFYARLFLCISMILFFLRIIYFGCILEKLGSIVKMISRMITKDLLPLIFIFLIFIISFGTVFQCLLFPNRLYIHKTGHRTIESKDILLVIGEIFRRATFTIFDSDYTVEEAENKNGLYEINEEGRLATFYFLIVYVVIVNVMLINLLIALFSNTVTISLQKSKESWRANRYSDIEEYRIHSILPPPFNILEIVCLAVKRKYKNEINVQRIPIDDSIYFTILQAIGLRNFRYNLLETPEDREREKEAELSEIRNIISKLQSDISKIETFTRKST